MAISQTERDQILKIVAGLFNGAPGGAILNDLSQAVEAGVSMAQLADILANTNQFRQDVIGGKVTTAQQVSVLMDNFGLTPDGVEGSPATLASEFFTARIDGGAGFGAIVLEAVNFLDNTTNEAFAPYSALLNNKALVAALHAESNNISGVADAKTILAGVTAAFPTTAAEAAQYLDDIGSGANPGQTLTLTDGVDTITGTAGDDVFNAPLTGAGPDQTLNDFDELDGGAGADRLNATLIESTGAPVLTSIENLWLRSRDNTAALDLSNADSVAQVWNDRSTNDLTVTDLQNSAVLGLNQVAHTTTYTVTYANDASGGVQTVVAQGAGNADNAVTLDVTDGGTTAITDLTINAASGVNNLDLAGDLANIENLTIAGSAALILNGGGFGAIESVDASDYTGNLDLDISGADLQANEASITLGSGDDRLVIDGSTLGDKVSIDLGAGNNTLAVGALEDFDLNDATVANVQTLEFDASDVTGDITLDLEDLASVNALLFADALDGGTNTLSVANGPESLAVTFEGAVGGVSGLTIDFGDTETVTINTEAAVADLVLTGESLDALTINAGANFAAQILGDDTADEEFSITSLTVTDTSEDGDAVIGIDLTDTVFLNAITLAGGAESDITIDAAAAGFTGTVTIDIGAIGVDDEGVLVGGVIYTTDDTNGVREIFKFTGDNIGDVEITGFLAGVGGNADRLDFSAFEGVSALDDINIEFTGGNTIITSDAFDGEITVNGVDLSTDAFNFVF